MLNFENIEDLVSYMFENFEFDKPVSIVANKELSIDIIKELITYEDTVIDICDINTYEYDKEYLVTLDSESDEDCWHIYVEQIYNYETESYYGMNGYVLFHEDINSKALIDMQKNEFLSPEIHDWFVVGEDIEENGSEESDNKESDSGSEDEFIIVNLDMDKMIRDINIEMFDMLYRPYLYEYHSLPIRLLW